MSFHEMLHIVLINTKSILKITLISSIILFVILLFIYPRTYVSYNKVLPPREENNFGNLNSLISGGDFSSMILGGGAKGNSQLYMEILKSRSVAEYVIKKHDLFNYLGTDDLQEATFKLLNDLDLDLSKEGIITVSVEVKSGFLPFLFSEQDSLKNLSAVLSNTFVEALDQINNVKLSTRAKRAREFIEEQLLVTKVALDSAENNLMHFQKENKAISLPDQLKSVIENAAQLKSEINQTEIALGLLKYNLSPESKTVLTQEKKLGQLLDQYHKLDLGNQDYLLAFNQVPELGKKLASLLREVKIQNEMYLFLQQQYYREKIQENKDVPTIEVLDEALPPIKQSSPRIIYSTITGGVFIFIILSLLFIIKEKRLYIYNSK
jgi:tyrosine-protein kinase Etk/Wzc